VLHEALTVETRAREQMVDITGEVARLLGRWKSRDGLVHVFVPHTSAGVTINENADPDVQSDMMGWLARLVPRDAPFAHYEGNSDSHLKATLVGSSVTVPLVDGRMRLGTWQGIYFCEFDGPRRRQVEVSLLSP
jgi:secondary thiamine-phosphate synthase enzyme